MSINSKKNSKADVKKNQKCMNQYLSHSFVSDEKNKKMIKKQKRVVGGSCQEEIEKSPNDDN